jgi:hypothetical protein
MTIAAEAPANAKVHFRLRRMIYLPSTAIDWFRRRDGRQFIAILHLRLILARSRGVIERHHPIRGHSLDDAVGNLASGISRMRRGVIGERLSTHEHHAGDNHDFPYRFCQFAMHRHAPHSRRNMISKYVAQGRSYKSDNPLPDVGITPTQPSYCPARAIAYLAVPNRVDSTTMSEDRVGFQ